MPEASINLKNQEVFTSNVVPNIKSFPFFVKINSDAPTLEKNEHTYKYDNANFRWRGNSLIDIQRKEIIQNVCEMSVFPKWMEGNLKESE